MPTPAQSHSRPLGQERKPQLSAFRRGYDKRWQRFRLHFLAHNPLCQECERQGRVTPAEHVHHVYAHKGDPKRFWDNEFAALCPSCHSRVTCQQDGGLGNAAR